MSQEPDLPGKGKKMPEKHRSQRPYRTATALTGHPLEREVCNIFVPPYGSGRAYVKKIKRPLRS